MSYHPFKRYFVPLVCLVLQKKQLFHDRWLTLSYFQNKTGKVGGKLEVAKYSQQLYALAGLLSRGGCDAPW